MGGPSSCVAQGPSKRGFAHGKALFFQINGRLVEDNSVLLRVVQPDVVGGRYILFLPLFLRFIWFLGLKGTVTYGEDAALNQHC